MTTSENHLLGLRADGRLTASWASSVTGQTVAVGLASFIALLLTMPRTLNIFDEGIVLTGAERVLAGEVPHRDFVSIYGPAQYYIVAAIMRLTGDHFLAPRLYDVVIRAAVVAAVFGVVRSQASVAVAGLFAVLCGAWMLTSENYLYAVFPCALLVLAGSWAVVRFARAEWGAGSMFGAGLCTGLTALLRYDVGSFLLLAHLVAIAALAAIGPRPLLRRSVLGCLAYGFGVALVFVPAAAAFLAVSPVQPFSDDVIAYGTHVYPATRNLPFPNLAALRADPGQASVYLPLLAAMLALFEVLRTARRLPPGLGTTSLVVFGAASVLLFLKGFVRVSTIHMLLAIVPSLVVLAIVVGRWSASTKPLRAGAWIILAIVAVPALAPAMPFVSNNRANPDLSLAGWLAERAGVIHPAPALRAECATGPVLTEAVVATDYARVSHYLDSHARLGERILVALDRHDRIFVNPVALYATSGHLPATRWGQFDPGVQTRADVQQAIIGELHANHVRWVVRDATFDGVSEPNASALSSGVKLLDQYLDTHYREVARSGPVAIWLLDGEEPGPAAGPCEAS